MAALAASDITVTVTSRTHEGKRRVTRGTMAFGDGALTYSTGGIPAPDKSNYGFIRQLDQIVFWGLDGLTSDYMLRYDKTNDKIQLFEEEGVAAGGPLLEADTSEAPAARTYNFEAIGW